MSEPTNSSGEGLSVAEAKPPNRRPWVNSLFFRVLRFGVLLVIVLAWFQRSLIYAPTRSSRLSAAEADTPQALIDVTVKAHDGIDLHGWLALAGRTCKERDIDWQAHLKQDRPLVLFFNGNGGNRKHRLLHAHVIGGLGADVLVFDHRGYGDNAGKPTESLLAMDARSIFDHVTTEMKVPAKRIVIYGESLGGGIATRLAHDLCKDGIEPGGLVIQSTFNSLVAAGGYHFPLLPVSLILIDRFPSEDRIGSVTCPILQLHGAKDTIVPLKLGQKLFAAAPEKSSSGIAKRQVILPNTDHNDVYSTDVFWVTKALEEFFSTVKKGK